ncbi:NADH dehydrogenase [ubiquinone] 1 alpha subcomplex assembly factor 4 [Brevipalpus obovatus]|uniref:NADH dehydrogenase [ubiquinone] 1 alpha subcomplex assembly factor 4 n=1 Tax=Brevipalpus obovatus TaxID=246614 RepID=UPI003D9F9B4A
MDKFRNFLKNIYVRGVKKKIMNYNAIERAMKYAEQEKKSVAPRHLSTQEKVMKYIEEHPEVKDIVVEKPKQLLERLKQVKVNSSGSNIEIVKPRGKTKPMIGKEPKPDPEPFGDEGIVKHVPPGRITLAQAMDVITECSYNPEKYKPSQLASDLNLKEEDVENLVNYFQPLEFVIPPSWSDDPEIRKKAVSQIWAEHQYIGAMAIRGNAEEFIALKYQSDPLQLNKTKEQILLEAKEQERQSQLALRAKDEEKNELRLQIEERMAKKTRKKLKLDRDEKLEPKNKN